MPKKALVVDDDFFFVEFLSEILERRGYRVIKASDGKEGVLRLNQGPFDVLFADLLMPKIDGKQLTRIARQRFPDRPFPVVIISGTLVEQAEDLASVGANHYVAKGPMDEMTEKIESLMDRIEGTALNGEPSLSLIEPGNIYPRSVTIELVDNLKFLRAVLESIGVGILLVDRDARVIQANPEALAMIHLPLEDILGSPITALFPREERMSIVDSLKCVVQNRSIQKTGLHVSLGSGRIRLIISLHQVEQEIEGWVVVLEEADQ